MRAAIMLTKPEDMPPGFDGICELIDRIEGVRFRELFARLPQRETTGDKALEAVLRMAQSAERWLESGPLSPLFNAATSGQDIEPWLAWLRRQLTGHPNIDEIILRIQIELEEVARQAKNQ
jgi:hypothetical protein